MFVQHRALDGGASDVKTYSHLLFLLRNNIKIQLYYTQKSGYNQSSHHILHAKIVFSAQKVKHFVKFTNTAPCFSTFRLRFFTQSDFYIKKPCPGKARSRALNIISFHFIGQQGKLPQDLPAQAISCGECRMDGVQFHAALNGKHRSGQRDAHLCPGTASGIALA